MDNIQIKVVAFGIARDIIGGREMLLDVSRETSAINALNSLKKQFPDLNKLVSLQLAINEEYVDSSHLMNEGDELVLIPPVSGG